ncbi:Neuropeptide Y receptor type 2 [Trichoplax sp. H2]|nr:Neuropeptide Y receptor type 2 [Trichoplax sp. H2]|eukprot:RDD40261.1 Neuropeptide Y receptor type 2 [Trichoplax sp. H2]
MSTQSNSNITAPTEAYSKISEWIASLGFFQILFLRILIPILIIGIINNVLLVIIIIREKSFHKSTYYLLCNQAIANVICLACILAFSLDVKTTVSSLNDMNTTQLPSIYLEGNYSDCALTSMIYQSSYTVSVLSLAVIALDRYRVLTQHTKKNYDAKVIFIANTLIWGIGWVNGYFFSNFTGNSQLIPSLCDYKFDSHELVRAYFTINFILTYLLPATIIIVSYSLIMRYLKREHSGIKSIAKIKRKRRNRVMEMAMVTTFFFLIPSSPWAISSLVLAFLQLTFGNLISDNSVTIIILYSIFQLFYFLTCIITPSLIAAYNRIIKSTYVSIYFFYLPKKWREAMINVRLLSCIIFHPFTHDQTRHSVTLVSSIHIQGK